MAIRVCECLLGVLTLVPPNDVEGRKLPLSQGLMTGIVLGSLAGLFVIYLTVSAIVHARRSARR